MRLLSVFALLFLYSLSVSATSQSECGSVSYKKSMGKNRDQGSTFYCGSFTAADLIGQKFGVGNRVSANHLVLHAYSSLVNLKKNPALSEYEFYKLQMNQREVAPFTYVKDLKVALSERTWDYGITFGLYPDMAAFTYNANGFICLDSDQDSSGSNLGFLEKDLANKLYNNQKTCSSDPNLLLDKPDEKTLSSLLEIARIEIASSCKKKKYLEEKDKIEPVTKGCYKDIKSECLSNINEGLNKGRIVGISYNLGKLTPADSNSGFHASSIVSRRWNRKKNTCEFEIRNSYGSECSYYKEVLECSEGNIWVSEDLLSEMILHTTYLK
ncbi:hypothetical protein D3C87_87020 [compost metagenome]